MIKLGSWEDEIADGEEEEDDDIEPQCSIYNEP